LLKATPARPRTVPNQGLENCHGGIGAGKLEIGFAAEDELSTLPVVAGLDAAGDAGRLRGIVVHRRQLIADIGAEIGAGPAPGDAQRRRCRVVAVVDGEIGCRGGANCGKRNGNGKNRPHADLRKRSGGTQDRAGEGKRGGANSPDRCVFVRIYRDV